MIDINFAGIKNERSLQDRFIELSKILMSEFAIELRHCERKQLRISALELYYFNREFWPDKSSHFTKGASIQAEPWLWYIHHNAKRVSTRMGIDITVGAGDPAVGASLLVRALNGIDGSGYAQNDILFGPRLPKEKRCWDYDDDVQVGSFGRVRPRDFLTNEVNRRPVFSETDHVALVRTAPVVPKSLYIGARVGVGRADDRHKRSHLRLATFISPNDLKDKRRKLTELSAWLRERDTERGLADVVRS